MLGPNVSRGQTEQLDHKCHCFGWSALVGEGVPQTKKLEHAKKFEEVQERPKA
jgi:hypothetical protein